MATILHQKLGPIGYGLLGFGMPHRQISDEQAFAAMKQALADGSNFWNGGEFYGTPESNSLTLLNRYFTKYPEDAEKVLVSIKGGLRADRTPDGSPEGVRSSVENCLRLLGGVKTIDIFQCARVDPDTPIETTIGTLAELIAEGKIGGIGLSEVSAATVRRAAQAHPIAAVEVEVSLFEDNILKNGVAEACAEHGIPIAAYSPVGRGFLTGQLKTVDDIEKGNPRQHFPRFSPENFPNNIRLVQKVQVIADRKGCTVAQLAINWVRQLSDRKGYPIFIPIPGTTTVERVKENAKVVTLSQSELAEIDQILSTFVTAGTRYPAAFLKHLDG